ncbi:MAG: hypothetical protein AAGN66_16225 [Acidobacteriota bacterium]
MSKTATKSTPKPTTPSTAISAEEDTTASRLRTDLDSPTRSEPQVFDWDTHVTAENLRYSGMPVNLGAPFVGLRGKFRPLSHPNVLQALEHAERQFRHTGGVREREETPVAIRLRANIEAVVSACRGLEGVFKVKGEERKFTFDDEWNEDGKLFLKSRLLESQLFVERCMAALRRLSELTQEEVLKMGKGAVLGEDINFDWED